MQDRTDVTVPMPSELDDQIKQQLEYGDSRAEWIRRAIRDRLDREGVDLSGEPETDGGQERLAD